ncbi:Heterokaryon incompatibility protein 6, OR allele [Madurella mycetomatis]|uniref:Heterokaryon incompatibility protein 6, OR allele n=1 Tax=Madurella mycetomatis TaxID=100816 RepID=A0A175W4F9_9PEZI|nr:Heterokaryon incompatibility protein 6, OR allele [Madurella mycetomatis]KXX81346.1 Heterokaryon incompatibility protein 6, OR allele [Madurella mycetomatis]
MASLQFYATCADCVKVLQDAASLLSSDTKKPRDSLVNLFHNSHRTRLIANVSVSKCRMCLLLSAFIPRLLQPLDNEELLALVVSRARHDLDAAAVGVIEESRHDDFDRLSLKNLGHVRIVSSAPLPANSQYLTLSHRWGNPPSILLTKKTSFLLSEDITPHLLDCEEATVFQHAIHVTRTLGFRYIWIDALCIMQDDGAEKTEDIMQMDDIYANGTLNISAAEGRIREGLVFNRDTLLLNPHRATVRVPDRYEDMHLQVFEDQWFLRPRECPLADRGWVFQERMLSPRIVHFTKEQLFWECQCLAGSEVLPLGVPGRDLARFGRGPMVSSDMSAQEAEDRWYEVVEQYSQTFLTFADDRLCAISAIAKRFCAALQLAPSDYLAGLWKSQLPLSLLWFQNQHQDSDTPEPTRIAAEIDLAPSWSWASIMAPIGSVRRDNLTATAEVLDVHIARISPNLFDGAEPGSCRLRLRGFICRFERRVQNGTLLISAAGQHAEFQEFNSYRFQKGRAIILEWDTARREVADWLEAFSNRPSPSASFLLHIAHENSVDGPMERGLILRRTTERGRYARAGSFFIPFTSEYAGSELDDVFSVRLKNLAANDYLELDKDGKVTIELV